MESDKLKDIVEDLFSLEVNTIVKANMTATRMPNMAAALVEIAIDYGTKLDVLTSHPSKALNGEASLASFQELEKLSRRHIDDAEGKPVDAGREADLFMLIRIRDNARQLQGIFHDKTADLVLNREEAAKTKDEDLHLEDPQKVLIRKVWELGTEEIAMQTVIYLDGDVITRLQPQYYQDEKKRALIPIHNKGVETTISFWGNLVKLAETFVTALLGAKG